MNLVTNVRIVVVFFLVIDDSVQQQWMDGSSNHQVGSAGVGVVGVDRTQFVVLVFHFKYGSRVSAGGGMVPFPAL
eukprot:1899611-Ditylum_brightwellii.AAC.1